MKILQVNDIDLPGRRFNGYDLQLMLNENGHEAKQIVMNKLSRDNNVISLINTQGGHFIREKCREFEERISLQSVAYPFGELLLESKFFKKADIVHYHLIFNHLLSLYSFKDLVNAKPSVWTLHDPWALTGHCVHPVDCQGWLTGCKNCPYLDRYSPLNKDNSNSIWNMKKEIYKSIDIDIVVSSQWMYDMVKRSPLTKHFERVHLIPFGIDLEHFKARKNKEEIRENLGIKKDSFVMMFRQDDQEWKGLPFIKEMLNNLKVNKHVTLLTVGKIGLLEEYKSRYDVIEYEWVNDNNFLVDLYSAADLFLMPSVAESFGMMAIEAMACSLPVVVMEGTALPRVTFAPEFGVSFSKGNIFEFTQKVSDLIMTEEELRHRQSIVRKKIEENYDIKIYNSKILKMYEKIYSKK